VRPHSPASHATGGSPGVTASPVVGAAEEEEEEEEEVAEEEAADSAPARAVMALATASIQSLRSISVAALSTHVRVGVTTWKVYSPEPSVTLVVAVSGIDPRCESS